MSDLLGHFIPIDPIYKEVTGHSRHGEDYLQDALIALGIATGAGAAGMGPMAGMFGGEAAAAAGAEALAPEAAGWAVGAGESLGGGLGSGILPAEAAAESSLFGLTPMGFGPESSLASSLLAPQSATPFITESTAATPFAPGAVTEAPGVASTFGPTAAQQSSKIGLSGDQAMRLGKMLLEQGGGDDRPQGAPPISADPNVRSQLMTQEQITKKWLLKNDPSTYARIYGAPNG